MAVLHFYKWSVSDRDEMTIAEWEAAIEFMNQYIAEANKN